MKFSIIIDCISCSLCDIESSFSSIFNQNYSDYEIIVLTIDDSNVSKQSLKDVKKVVKLDTPPSIYTIITDVLPFTNGEYVYFMMSNCVLDQSFFKTLDYSTAKFDSDIIIFGNLGVSNGKIINKYCFDNIEIINNNSALNLLANNTIDGNLENKIFKKSLFAKTSLDSKLIDYDPLLLVHLFSKSNKVTLLNKILCYCDGDNFKDNHNIGNIYISLILCLQYLENNNIKVSSSYMVNIDKVLSYMPMNIYFKTRKYVFPLIKDTKIIEMERALSKLNFLFKKSFNYPLTNLFFRFFDRVKKYIQRKKQSKIKVISSKYVILGVPKHNNIGDHAIAIAENNFIEKYLNSDDIELLSEDNCAYSAAAIKKKQDSVYFLQGGGNMGNNYVGVENIRRNVIKALDRDKNKKSILFPQTIFFEKNVARLNEKNTFNFYKLKNNILFFFREKYSFELAKQLNFPNCYLVPDIVLSLLFTYDMSDYYSNDKRENVLLVLRNDKESTTPLNDYLKIRGLLNDVIHDIFFDTDTTMPNFENYHNDSKTMVFDKIKQFSNCKMIITDRLHGMVLSILAGTPCIVLNNYNKKVIGVYEWVKSLSFVRMINNISEIEDNINYLKNIDRQQIISELKILSNELENNFASLIDAIKQINK